MARVKKRKTIYTSRRKVSPKREPKTWEFIGDRKLQLGIGFVLALAVILIVAKNLEDKITKNIPPIPSQITTLPISRTVSPTSSTVTPIKMQSQKQVRPSEKPSVMMQKSLIKNLPNTSGESFTYTVKQNDNIAKLGMVFCNDKAAWIYLASKNNLSYPYVIHPKETIQISCN